MNLVSLITRDIEAANWGDAGGTLRRGSQLPFNGYWVRDWRNPAENA
jgi:hypothetical protein